MSLHESSTSKQILQTFPLQRNADMHKSQTQRTNHDYQMSDELQQIKNEYAMLERKNQEELEILQHQLGRSANPDFPDFRDFLGKSPGLHCNLNNDFTRSIESIRDWKREINKSKCKNDKLDMMLSSKNDQIAFMKKQFLTFTETYKLEAEKLAAHEKKIKAERDDLQRKLKETQKKFDLQNDFVKELEDHNLDLKVRVEEINKEIEREIKKLTFEAETEKKRYLANLKKLIELFQMEKVRMDEVTKNLNSDINLEKNQHFQEVEQLKEIIDQLKDEIEKQQQEKAIFYAEAQKYTLNKSNEEDQLKLLQEIEDHRKYSHELEMIIKNLGQDNQTLENENAELKKRYEEKLEQIKDDTEDNRRQLHEELEMFKHKFNNLQEIKAENEFIMAENEALKKNLNSIDEKYVRRVRVLNADYSEKHRLMSLQIENQNDTIEHMKTEQRDLKSLIMSLENELRQKNSEIKNLESYKASLENKKIELQTTLDKSRQLNEQTIREHEDHVNKLRSLQEAEVKKYKNEIGRLQKENADLQTGLIEQETLYKILKVDFDENSLERDAQITKFNKEKEEIVQQYDKKIEGLNSQIEELQTINLNYEEIEQDLHKQIQNLVHNMNQINYDNQLEVEKLRQEIRKQIGQELEELQKFKEELEEQIKLNEKDNARLKSELQFKSQRCSSLEEELKALKISHQDLSGLLQDSRERYEDEIEQLKLSNERTLKRNKDEITKLLKEFEQQSIFCDHLDKRKKELERLNKNYTDNLEHVTKVYEREMEDLRLDLQNTKTFYENKLSHTKTEATFQTKKYENRINELEQEVKIVKYEVEWLREVQRE